jgi:hypothetical protein
MSINILIVAILVFINKMSINFLLQATKILHTGNYTESELRTMFDYLTNLDNAVLNSYLSSSSVLQYTNDLELYIEVIDKLLKVLEEKEEYEMCQVLFNKKEESLDIMNVNINKYEHT